MKREFLLGLQVEGSPLPKEIIDAIMAENGRDIQKVRAGFADYDEVKEALAQLQQTAQEIQVHKDAARDWEEKYTLAEAEHQKALSQMAFQHNLDSAIQRAQGRSAKAICALLDLDTLRESENQPQAIEAALLDLKQTSRYLFEEAAAPLYARGTGAWQGAQEKSPTTLAGALKERFERK